MRIIRKKNGEKGWCWFLSSVGFPLARIASPVFFFYFLGCSFDHPLGLFLQVFCLIFMWF